MAINEDYLKYILDQLSEFKNVNTKRMFGGVGLFHNELMFGKIGGDTFRLRVDDINKKEYEERGMKPFFSEKKKKGMPYWEVPTEILDDKKKLANWATKAYEAAERNKKK